jgi:lipopolysaccharide transport system ATP-binding protein
MKEGAAGDLLQPHVDTPTAATHDSTASPNATDTAAAVTAPPEDTGRIVAIEAWTDDGQQGRELAIHSQTTSLFVRVRFASNPDLPAPSVGFGIGHISGVTVTSGLSHQEAGLAFPRDAQGQGEVTLHLPQLPLLQGDYFLSVVLGCERGLHIYDMAERIVVLRVNQSGLDKGWVTLPHEWQVTPQGTQPLSQTSLNSP